MKPKSSNSKVVGIIYSATTGEFSDYNNKKLIIDIDYVEFYYNVSS